MGARANQRPDPDRRRLPAKRRRGGTLASPAHGSHRRSLGRPRPSDLERRRHAGAVAGRVRAGRRRLDVQLPGERPARSAGARQRRHRTGIRRRARRVARPDVVRVVATGCTRTGAGATCAASIDAASEATARLEAAWALLPALRAVPSAALTVQGDVDVGAASLGVHNVDAASGALAVHAGGRIAASALRVGAPPGAALGTSLASGDADLRALPADRFFARTFGMGMAAWAGQPAARRIDCASDCARAIDAAIGAGARLLFIDGDATIAGPATFGSADDPIVLVATGALRISGDVALHGVVHGASLEWNDATPGRAFVRGAVLVGGGYGGNGAVDLRRDAAVLAHLTSGNGSFVRINGSWKDF